MSVVDGSVPEGSFHQMIFWLRLANVIVGALFFYKITRSNLDRTHRFRVVSRSLSGSEHRCALDTLMLLWSAWFFVLVCAEATSWYLLWRVWHVDLAETRLPVGALVIDGLRLLGFLSLGWCWRREARGTPRCSTA